MGRSLKVSSCVALELPLHFSLPQTHCILCTLHTHTLPKTFGIVPAWLLGTQQKRTQHPVQGLENACSIGRAVSWWTHFQMLIQVRNFADLLDPYSYLWEGRIKTCLNCWMWGMTLRFHIFHCGFILCMHVCVCRGAWVPVMQQKKKWSSK